MGSILIGLIKVLAAAGMVLAIISGIVVYIRLRISRSNRSLPLIARLTFFENTKQDYIFIALVVIGVILANIVVRL